MTAGERQPLTAEEHARRIKLALSWLDSCDDALESVDALLALAGSSPTAEAAQTVSVTGQPPERSMGAAIVDDYADDLRKLADHDAASGVSDTREAGRSDGEWYDPEFPDEDADPELQDTLVGESLVMANIRLLALLRRGEKLLAKRNYAAGSPEELWLDEVAAVEGDAKSDARTEGETG